MGTGEVDSTHKLHHRPTCRICHRELPLSRRVVAISARNFCKEHWRQYKIRQREGVTSEDLNSSWSDTLDNWRERPVELDEEVKARRPSATPLYFWRRYENWVLFMRRYYIGLPQMLRSRGVLGIIPRKHRSVATLTLRGGKGSFVSKLLYGDGRSMSHRAGDCLAVNLQTGELRRLVDVQEETVLDDLQGIRVAPYQTEIAAFWGKPEPTGIVERFRQRYMDQRHHFRVTDLVHLASFPVYGVFDNAFDFSVCGLGVSGDVWGGIREVLFVFSSERYQQERENLVITSSYAREPYIYYDPEQAVHDLIMRYRLDEEQQEQAGNPPAWEGEMIIDNVMFNGEIRHWSQPFHLSLFRLTSEKTMLTGNACGPSQDELFHVLKGLRIINEQDALLARYQREFDGESQRLFNQS